MSRHPKRFNVTADPFVEPKYIWKHFSVGAAVGINLPATERCKWSLPPVWLAAGQRLTRVPMLLQSALQHSGVLRLAGDAHQPSLPLVSTKKWSVGGALGVPFILPTLASAIAHAAAI